MPKKSKVLKCCICGKEIEGYGNNPAGAATNTPDGKYEFLDFDLDDRCCDICNMQYVIPGRIYMNIMMHKEKEKK